MNFNKISDSLGFSTLIPKSFLGQSKDDITPPPVSLGPKEVYISWSALDRAEKRESNEKFNRTFLVIGIVVALLFVLMKEFFLILLVVSIIFVKQALAKTAPELVKYEINSHGVLIGEKTYYWGDLKDFFFTSAGNSDILAIDTILGFPGRLFLTLDTGIKDKVRGVLEPRITFLVKEPKTFIEIGYESIMSKFSFKDTSQDK